MDTIFIFGFIHYSYLDSIIKFRFIQKYYEFNLQKFIQKYIELNLLRFIHILQNLSHEFKLSNPFIDSKSLTSIVTIEYVHKIQMVVIIENSIQISVLRSRVKRS